MISITPEEVHLLGRFVHERSGIVVDETKGYLLETRLQSLLAAEGVSTFRELYQKAKAGPPDGLAAEVVDAITTNETYFFRDNAPFDLLKFKIIPDLIDRRRRAGASGRIPLRFWSAASSTGQEVYSIAMTLCELLPDIDRYDISILGTDISRQVLARASYGKYTEFEVQRGLPGPMLSRYFTRVADGWKVHDRLRAMAKFRLFNLRSDFQELGRFDVIFCRNVAIYFSNPDKVMLFKKLAHALVRDGTLIVGGSESLSGLAPDFAPQQHLRGIYYQLQEFFLEHAAAVQSPRHEGLELPPAPPKPPAAEKPAEPPPVKRPEETASAKPPVKGKRRKAAAIPALSPMAPTPVAAEKQPAKALTPTPVATAKVQEDNAPLPEPPPDEIVAAQESPPAQTFPQGPPPGESLQSRLRGREAAGETLLGKLAGQRAGGESLLARKSGGSGKPGLLSSIKEKTKKEK